MRPGWNDNRMHTYVVVLVVLVVLVLVFFCSLWGVANLFRRMSLQPHSYLHPRGLEYSAICKSFAEFANVWSVACIATARELRALVARDLKW